AGVPGGIPSGANYTQCGSTISAYTGDASIVNTAIQNCAGADATHPKYVLLGPGTFTLSSAIRVEGKDFVSLRGSGPDQTIVKVSSADCGILTAGVCLGVRSDQNNASLEWLGSSGCVFHNDGSNCQHSWNTVWTGAGTTISESNGTSYPPGSTVLRVGSTANM